MNRLTIGITTFDRPDHLRQCLTSIDEHYSRARIVVADNGEHRAEVPGSVELVGLPYDVGLSASRNAIIDRLDTDYLLFMEDDMLFTRETRVETLVEILDRAPEIGAVGGALLEHGHAVHKPFLLDRFRDELRLIHAHLYSERELPSGTCYRFAHAFPNFFLGRREFFADHKWDPALKVGEHLPYFWTVWQARKWRLAYCGAVRVAHDRTGRSADYLVMRRRATALRNAFFRERGINRVVIEPTKPPNRAVPWLLNGTRMGKHPQPNIVIMGVGHSGTTILARMLAALGWNTCDAEDEYCESVAVRGINRLYGVHGEFSIGEARAVITAFDQPWVIKDPRFSVGLHQWIPVFERLATKPLLLWICRNRDSVVSSFRRRGAIPGREEDRVDLRWEQAVRQYDGWPWAKVRIDYERLADAVELFDLGRARRSD